MSTEHRRSNIFCDFIFIFLSYPRHWVFFGKRKNSNLFTKQLISFKYVCVLVVNGKNDNKRRRYEEKIATCILVKQFRDD